MLKLVNIGKKFSSQTDDLSALKNIDLEIKNGEFFSLIGPSGCGKSTLLRLISGLEALSEGQILLSEERIDQLAPEKRPFHMVFQRYALFPHLSVFDNVAFGPRIRGLSQSEVKSKVMTTLEKVGLQSFADRKPETLSGGQAQRVAVARALVNEPKVLLLDEPLAALDLKMREHMQHELRTLQKQLGLTFIYVTHDQEEALAMSDRIAVMNEGCIEQVGSPEEIYSNPKSSFVAQFIGSMKKLSGTILNTSSEHIEMSCHNQIANIRGVSTQSLSHFLPGTAVSFFVRPEKIKIDFSEQSQDEGFNVLPAKVKARRYRGASTLLTLELISGAEVGVSVDESSLASEIKMDDVVRVRFLPKDTLIFLEAKS